MEQEEILPGEYLRVYLNNTALYFLRVTRIKTRA